MRIFYRGDKTRCSDIIPFYDNGVYKPFYLKRWPPGYSGVDAKPGWYMLDTDDFVSFSEHDTGISGATGSVIFTSGLYHMFFCRITEEAQTIHHAVSCDLRQWDELPEDAFGPDNVIYALSDWRDSFVFYNEEEGKWWMLVCAAQKNAQSGRSGCIALCASDDLHHWEFREPFYAPGVSQSALECPDLFKIGALYYLVYSTASDRFQTVYRISRELRGPWMAPEIDTFDTRAYYAAKTAGSENERYLFAWVASKDFNIRSFNPPVYFGKDYGSWDHGGSMVIHRLNQNTDGTLSVSAPASVKDAFKCEENVQIHPIQGNWLVKGNSADISSPYSYSAALLNLLPEICRIQMKVSFDQAPLSFGVALQVDKEFVRGYYILLEPNRQRMEWKSAIRMYEDGGVAFPYEVELERPVSLEKQTQYTIDILIERDLVVTYFDGQTAMSSRAYDYSSRHLGLFVSHGKVYFSDIRLFTVE